MTQPTAPCGALGLLALGLTGLNFAIHCDVSIVTDDAASNRCGGGGGRLVGLRRKGLDSGRVSGNARRMAADIPA